ncbi:tyrosine aminotransferase [Klebsormidium nitens]|uniref:Tyrosine aminotransferase n=1 Tax=Klebsormidium nitens TaxID=105231 RepID=A0A1Y1I4L5_KLENI|nr:tyrosine aminotransferase [Klebsormidium nitens]|eukprot:GAQ85880.1 tyrosine aminotransferase [Klebsormidium nitens]
MPPAAPMAADSHNGCPPRLDLLDESLKVLHEFDVGAFEGPWKIDASAAALRAINPIRVITDAIKVQPHAGKELLSVAIGDPCVFGNLQAPKIASEALIRAVQSGAHNGYTNSLGLPECREAVAEYHNARLPRCQRVAVDDVIVTSGCSQALQVVYACLANPGANILLPRPGFPLYLSLAQYFDIEVRFYDLLAERGWEADPEQIRALTNKHTVALLICNPGNPSGAVYSRRHLQELADLAAGLRIPIIADEVYGGMVFEGREFVPIASVAHRTPVLTVGGISKRWLVPGWRLGWLILNDPIGVLTDSSFREAAVKMMQMLMGPATITQAAVPTILRETPAEFFDGTLRQLQAGADYCVERIARIRGLECPGRPHGSMFLMARLRAGAFPAFESDVEFARELLQEEAVVLLPGTAFGAVGWLRVVFVAPLSILERVWDRVEAFCDRHAVSGETLPCKE